MENIVSYILYMAFFTNSIFWSHQYSKKAKVKISKKEKIIYCLLITIPIIILQGYRYNVGTDYQSYLELYNGFNEGNKTFISWYMNEPLFIFICKVLYKITFGSESALFVFNALVMEVFVFLTFDYYKEKVNLPILYIFYYATCFPYFLNAERQGVTVAIIWYSIRFAYEKKPIKFLIYILIATLIHNTAIIGILFYVILHIEKNNSKYLKKFMMVLAAAMPIIFGASIDFLSNYVPIFRKYTKFLTDTEIETVNTNFIFFVFMLLILLWLKKFIDKEKAFLITFTSVMHVMTFLLNNYIAWGFRMSFYFEIGMMLGYSYIYRNLKYRSNKRILGIFIATLMIFYFTYKFYIQGNSEIFPYQFIWAIKK